MLKLLPTLWNLPWGGGLADTVLTFNRSPWVHHHHESTWLGEAPVSTDTIGSQLAHEYDPRVRGT